MSKAERKPAQYRCTRTGYYRCHVHATVADALGKAVGPRFTTELEARGYARGWLDAAPAGIAAITISWYRAAVGGGDGECLCTTERIVVLNLGPNPPHRGACE